MAAATNPLPPGPVRCRACGKEMDAGFVAGESVRMMTPADVVWVDKKTGYTESLTQAGWFAWSKSPQLEAYLCGSCGIVEIHLPPEPPDEET